MKKRNNKIRQTHLGAGVKVNTSQIGRYNKQLFCTGDNKNNIHIWSFEEQNPVQALLPSINQASQTEVSALTFTNDQNSVVSGSNRGIINVWDIQTAKISCTLKGHSASINTFTIFPADEIRLASGSYDTNIKLWDLRTRQSKITLKGHTKQVNSLQISPDDKLLISGSQDGTVKLWDLRFPQKIITTYTQHIGPINCVKFNPQDIMFASAGADKTAKYFQCEPGMYVYVSSTDLHSHAITAIQFSNDGNLLYTACNDSLKIWKMGKDGMLVDNVDSSWKGVQDLCLIDNTLVGIAFNNGYLSFWAFETNNRSYDSDQKPKTKKQQKQTNVIKNNRSEDLKDVRNNVDKALNKINDLEKKQSFKKNLSTEQGAFKEEPRKKNFVQQLHRRKIQQEKKKQEQRVIAEQIQRMNKEEKRKVQQLRIKRQQEQRFRKQNAERARKEQMILEQKEAKRIEQERNDQEIAKFNEDMAQQQQKRTQAHRLMESVLYDEKLDATLNASQFMIDQQQKQKFKQFDTINQILKQSGKFSEVLSFRLSRVKPIIKWWVTNNIKSALYALNQAAASVVVDALNTIFNNGKMKSLVTSEIATALCRKSAELILDKHSQYVRSGIVIINEIVSMFKEDLIRIKSFNPGARVDLSREDRIAKYDKLIECFLGVFKMDRVIKYAKNSSHELHQPTAVLYKNLEQILRKWTAKSEAQLVC